MTILKVKHISARPERVFSGRDMLFVFSSEDKPIHICMKNMDFIDVKRKLTYIVLCGEKVVANATGSWTDRGKVCRKCLTIAKI